MAKKTKTSNPSNDGDIQPYPIPMTCGTEAVGLTNDNAAKLLIGPLNGNLPKPFWGSANSHTGCSYTGCSHIISLDSTSTVLDAATQAILTQRADVMPLAVKVAQVALERLLEALQPDFKAKEGDQ